MKILVCCSVFEWRLVRLQFSISHSEIVNFSMDIIRFLFSTCGPQQYNGMRKQRTNICSYQFDEQIVQAHNVTVDSNAMENQIAFIIIKLNNVNKSVSMCDTVLHDAFALCFCFDSNTTQ